MHYNLYTQKSPPVRILWEPCTIYTHRNPHQSESCENHAPFIHTEIPTSQNPVRTVHHLYTQKSPIFRLVWERDHAPIMHTENPLQSDSCENHAPRYPLHLSLVKTMHHLYTQKSPTSKPCKDHAPFIHTEMAYSQSPVKTMHHLYTQKSATVRVL